MGTSPRARVLALALAGLLIALSAFHPAAAGPQPKKRLTVAFQELSDCMVWRDREIGKFIPWLAERWQKITD